MTLVSVSVTCKLSYGEGVWKQYYTTSTRPLVV